MPRTTPYAQDGALAYALPAAATVHLHTVVSVIAVALFRDVVVVVTSVVIIVVIVVGLRAQNAVRAFGLRLHFGLQEWWKRALTGDITTFYDKLYCACEVAFLFMLRIRGQVFPSGN